MPNRHTSMLIATSLIAWPLPSSAQQTAAPANPAGESSVIAKHAEGDWLEVTLESRTMLINPATGEANMVVAPDPPTDIRSPDGKYIAYITSDPQRVKAGHDLDLFVADLKTKPRRLTTDQTQPSIPLWLPNSGGIVFQAGEGPGAQVWYVDLAPDSQPVRLSDGEHRAYGASILSDGRIAWIVHKGNRNKEQFKDLVLHSSPSVSGKLRTLLTDQHISGYAFSPDGKTLAWSGLGSMFLVNVESGESREIPLHGIHRQLINHTAYAFVWRPDGKVIAIHCGFLGGISRGLNADPNQPWPRMFAEDKVFFVPVDWTPAADALTVGEGDKYPSPTADDPKAEISPPAGDESMPWWVREIPMRPLDLKWISAAVAKEWIEQHPAPPGEKLQEPPSPMPHVPPPTKPSN